MGKISAAILGIGSILLLSSCGKASFTGVVPNLTKTAEKAAVAEETAASPSPEEAKSEGEESPFKGASEPTAGIPQPLESTASAEMIDLTTCSKLMADNPDQVIKTSQSPASLALNDNSIVLLEVQGKATINLNAKDIQKIKALCVRASGDGALTIATSLNIGGVWNSPKKLYTQC